MEDKYTFDEMGIVLDMAERIGHLLKRMDAVPELKAKVVCPRCRYYAKDMLDRVTLHGVHCGMSCMRGLAGWIKEEADLRIKAFHDAMKGDASQTGELKQEYWYMDRAGEQPR